MEMKKTCALVIGHARHSQGAVNKNTGLTEFSFNSNLVTQIKARMGGMKVYSIYRDTYSGLPGYVNTFNPDFIISLHCNAFNEKASGTEVLYYHKSKSGKKMADIFISHLVDYLKLPNRGTKPKTTEESGGHLLRYTNAPCIIVEPFFIDNDNDLNVAQQDLDGLADVYVNAIHEISYSI